ncbi:hypothetical protein [Verrucosispora sp. NA02020]|uniref:hypothetical protein n=1 Tax=Verrucosispora sp. NA02020 TaxID=2742132 RepID=UPI001590779F|nr:hypothetical protein [Verrucosispora sp. NA02020]QKW13382.1 hypothetical protein HUT12_11705 [Verrucosispora sp. NA02020]
MYDVGDAELSRHPFADGGQQGRQHAPGMPFGVPQEQVGRFRDLVCDTSSQHADAGVGKSDRRPANP